MTAVLMTPPYLQFLDDNGLPLAGGMVYTFTATGTFSTPKATYTTQAGDVEHPNPVILDSSGRPKTGNGSIWLSGTYDFRVCDANDVEIKTTLNVTAFTTTPASSSAYFQTFSGTGSQTAFTTSSDLGTDEKAIYIWIDSGLQESVVNGNFATDSDWTKGSGWTIGAGVATATGAISTAISQTSDVALVEGEAYIVTFTITRSAGGLIPSIGGKSGTERTSSATFSELIIAGSTQAIAFTGNGFTGTLDDVSVTVANGKGFEIQNPSNYTIDGTTLTFVTAPAEGTNNIYVSAPSLLVGAASSAASDAAASAAEALAAEVGAVAANVALQYSFDTSTTIADPGTGDIRFDNATLSNVTEIAISALTDDTGNPDVSPYIVTWDDSTHSPKGTISIRKSGSVAGFVIFSVIGGITDNGTWLQIPVEYVTSDGSLSLDDALYIGFSRSGNDGAGGDASTNTTSSSVGQIALFADTTGKLIGKATTTGVLKATSGVIAAAVQGTDYYAPNGTDVAIIDGGTGASSASAAFDNLKQAATDISTGVVEKATSAEVAAETTEKYPDSALLKYHPGVLKAWVQFDTSGTVADSYNVSSVSDTSASTKTINFTNALANSTYGCAITVIQSASSSYDPNPTMLTRTTTSLLIYNVAEGVANITGWSVAVFGDM